MLQLDRVSRHYRTGGAVLKVLEGVDLQVVAGQSMAIVGPSGCGKSTLLNLMGALDEPTSGRVVLDGRDIGRLDDRERARIRNQRFGFVFQDHHLLPQCTVLENVLVPTLVRKCTAEDRARAKGLLERVGLADKWSHRPGQLSGGERQRVALVRALINQPAVVLADEPTGSLDRGNAVRLVELLVEVNRQQGAALVMVSHSLELAQRLGQVYELRDARLYPLGEQP